jgi:hypothetical protein
MRFTLLTVALVGTACRPAPPVVPTVAVPGAALPSPSAAVDAGAAPPAAAFHLPSDGVVPEGCFAWSPRTGAAACAIGIVGHNMPGTGETFHAEWRVAFLGDPGARPLDLVTAPPDGAGFFRTNAPPAPAARAQLEAALSAGGYVGLGPLQRRLRAGAPLAWAAGAEILWTRRTTAPEGENQAPRYTDTLAIRWAPGGALTPIETREDAPVESPEYAVYLLPGERFAVVSDVAGYGDEGVAGMTASAFRCDRLAKRCE